MEKNNKENQKDILTTVNEILSGKHDDRILNTRDKNKDNFIHNQKQFRPNGQ